jgi:hypothetical protein
MAQREVDQSGSDVPMHKRIAMGQSLDGTKLEGGNKSQPKSNDSQKKQSGLAALRKK